MRQHKCRTKYYCFLNTKRQTISFRRLAMRVNHFIHLKGRTRDIILEENNNPPRMFTLFLEKKINGQFGEEMQKNLTFFEGRNRYKFNTKMLFKCYERHQHFN